MGSFKFIEHDGKKILDFDFSNADKNEIVHLLTKANELISKEPPYSVRIITNIQDVQFDVNASDHFSYIAEKNKIHIKASAIYGVNQNQMMLIKGVGDLIDRKFNLFTTRKEAIDWIIAQP